MTMQGIVVAIGGVVLLLALIGFARSIWRKPPDQPGSNDPLGGMPSGGASDIGPGHHGGA